MEYQKGIILDEYIDHMQDNKDSYSDFQILLMMIHLILHSKD